jgi:hypothetical protein
MESTNITPLFFLVAFLCLFGYLIFSNSVLHGRIEQLKEATLRTRGREGGPDLTPFAWDLLDFEEGLPLLGEGLAIRRCGLYLVGAQDPPLLETLTANMIYQILSLDDVAVVYASRRVEPDRLGRRLLSLEARTAWESLSAQVRRKIWQRFQRDAGRYETSLYFWHEPHWSAEGLLEGCQNLCQDQDLAAVIVDEPEVWTRPDADVTSLMEQLRLLSIKCGVPVFMLMTTTGSEFTRWQALGGDRLQGIIEFGAPAEGEQQMRIHYVKYPEAPPTASFELKADSGQIVQT